MSFLDLNGIAIPVRDGTAVSNAPEIIGDVTRAQDGTLRSTRQAIKEGYKWQFPPMTASDSLAWKQLLFGLGDHWSFDTSSFSGKGLGSSSATNATINVSTFRWGAGCLQVDQALLAGGVSAQIQFTPSGSNAINGPNGWTIMAWVLDQAGVTWNHYILTSAGGIWKNGVTASADADTACIVVGGAVLSLNEVAGPGGVAQWQASHFYALNSIRTPTSNSPARFYKATVSGTSNSTPPVWPTTLGNTVTDGGVTWTDQGPCGLFLDDLVVLPYVVLPAWPALLYTFAASQAFPNLPKLNIAGTWPKNQNVLGIADVGETQMIQAALAGSFASNNQTLDATLREV